MTVNSGIHLISKGMGLARISPSTLFWVVTLGLVMPLVSALLFPTYFTKMTTQGHETLRLLEAPYVLFEIGFILWAGRRGFDLSAAAASLPRDIKLAGGVLVFALFASSAFISKNVSYALTHSMMWLVHLIFALAVLHFFKRHKLPDSDGFMSWHALGLVALAAYTAWWFSFPPPIEDLPFGEIMWRGAVPGFIDVRHFGSWTGAIAAGFAIRILYGEENEGLAPARLFYSLSAGLTVWSGTRAAILAIIIVTLVFVIAQRRLPGAGRIVWAAVLTLVACAGAYLFLVDDIAFWLIVPSELASAEELTATRSVLWGRTIELWLQSPWLGLGSGSIFWEFGPEKTPTQPHNVILQFLISWGVVGTAAGLWILGRAIRAVNRHGMALPACFAILGFLYALLFQSLLEGMLHYPRFIISIIVMAAIVFHFGKDDCEAGTAISSR